METKTRIENQRGLPCRSLVRDQAAGILLRQYHAEIERAVDNVKCTKLDRWFRQQWYKAEARGSWTTRRRFAHDWANRHTGGRAGGT